MDQFLSFIIASGVVGLFFYALKKSKEKARKETVNTSALTAEEMRKKDRADNQTKLVFGIFVLAVSLSTLLWDGFLYFWAGGLAFSAYIFSQIDFKKF